MKYRFTWFVAALAALAALGAIFGQHGGLASALAWAVLGAGAWLALLVCLVVCRLISRVVLWLARQLGFGHSQARCSSYASPAPRRSTVSAPRRYNESSGYSGAGYAAAAAGVGVAAWGDMHDPLAAAQAQQLEQMHQEPQRMFPLVNTNGISMSSDSGVDDLGHTYGDPAPVFETPSYDYSNNFGGGCNTGGGFDF